MPDRHRTRRPMPLVATAALLVAAPAPLLHAGLAVPPSLEFGVASG